MKKSALIIILLVFTSALSSQQIAALQLSPSNPSTNDSITLIADVFFSSGTCDQKELTMSQNGNDFYASAIHCIGALTYICNSTDSFNAGTLPAGNYRFIYHVDAGFGNVPCTPGIVSGPTDTLSFTVTNTTSFSEMQEEELNCYFANNQIIFNSDIQNATLSIYNSIGERVYHAKIFTGRTINFLTSGIYIISVQNSAGSFQKRIIIP